MISFLRAAEGLVVSLEWPEIHGASFFAEGCIGGTQLTSTSCSAKDHSVAAEAPWWREDEGQEVEAVVVRTE